MDFNTNSALKTGISTNISPATLKETCALSTGQVMLKTLGINGDDRGSLIAIEALETVPFEIRRVYYIFGTTAGVRRGQHAHKNLEQLIVATSGTCCIETDTGFEKQSFNLNSPAIGLYMNGGVWREMVNFSPDCVLMVLASQHYDPTDYIMDYGQFIATYRPDTAQEQ